ncbi:probable tRNA (uracil-O(2)-)-methyltransferase isoform X1 [Danaus plexippus]|uniref:probable tRNA (uracil-O(2)-)-methyltransferase isoform X1 n=1 Tax=Danaus plexippus TaxID=13037 RepID=UPI002AB298F2|nr:probable tRNA (uracil-O(2)-)-methyltransferase isoform X1 [Danaus plexippus]
MDLKTHHNDPESSLHSFWQAINILITKPHIVNKRLWGCTVLHKFIYTTSTSTWDSDLKKIKIQSLPNHSQLLTNLTENLKLLNLDEVDAVIEIIIVELFPKSYDENHAYQMICLNKNKNSATFIDITPTELKQILCPTFPYTFCNENDIILRSSDTDSKSYMWLKETVLPQVIKWSNELINDNARNFCNESLALVSNDKYYLKYNDLKLKYGKNLVKIWPECTDPGKFVYEDIAIATYLLLLWEEYGPQTFVDVGCGNGLLVYILTMEGHFGLGVDVRKRKIWDMYPKNIKLRESTVTPSNIHEFSDVDWIIGNHSDELTPWIPVISAISSYNSKFFLLPCCAYNFDGSKYRRQDSSKSQYTEYLEYIKNLCDYCGFETHIDRLKIPSTKRICLIGKMRKYKEHEHGEYCSLVNNLLEKEIGVSNCHLDNDNVKTRDPVERVRNCTQIDKDISEEIVMCVAKYLLEDCSKQLTWSIGRKTELKDLIQLIPNDKLKVLKSECGGLQTLLKNNHHIFKVERGFVQLRHPRTVDELEKNFKSKNNNRIRIKVKKCWFFNNHPQGCPLDSTVCSFLHEHM